MVADPTGGIVPSGNAVEPLFILICTMARGRGDPRAGAAVVPCLCEGQRQGSGTGSQHAKSHGDVGERRGHLDSNILRGVDAVLAILALAQQFGRRARATDRNRWSRVATPTCCPDGAGDGKRRAGRRRGARSVDLVERQQALRDWSCPPHPVAGGGGVRERHRVGIERDARRYARILREVYKVSAAAFSAGAISRCMRLAIAASSAGMTSSTLTRSTWSLKVLPGELLTKLPASLPHSR